MPSNMKVMPHEILKAALDYDLFHSEQSSLLPPSHNVWTRIKEKLDGKLSTKYLWLIFHVNRYSLNKEYRSLKGLSPVEQKEDLPILKKAGDSDETQNDPKIPSPSKQSQVSDSSYTFFERVLGSKCPTLNVTMHLSTEAWGKICPVIVVHKDQRSGRRKYWALKKGWTDILAEEIWKQLHLPCIFKFRKGHISKSPSCPFLSINAICVECHAKFSAHSLLEPEYPEDGLHLEISTEDTRGIFHSKKRHLTGEYRTDLGRSLGSSAASNWRREEANRTMNFGDPQPPHLFSEAVLRKAKQESRDEDLFGRSAKNLIDSLFELKIAPEFKGVIKEICINKFHFIYWTNQQTYIYQQTARRQPVTVFIDATGSLVKKISLNKDHLSGDIFLYQAVISSKGYTIPIMQMLSEKHNANIITYWIREWLRAGVSVPKVVVTDFSLALINASCLSFNVVSLADYRSTCFRILNNDKAVSSPPTYLRIDIAHLMKLVSRWKCCRDARPRIKDFFMRCVGLLASSTSLNEFTELLISTLVVSLSETEGSCLTVNKITSCERRIEFLLDRIKTFNCDEFNAESDKEHLDSNDDFFCEEDNAMSCVNEYIKSVVQRAGDEAAEEGVRINPYYLPGFHQSLVKLSKYFILWAGVMAPLYGQEATASTSYVESYFKTLKNSVFSTEKLPLRVDKFLVQHVRSIHGTEKIYFSSMQSCQKTVGKNIESKNTLEIVEEEKVDDALNLNEVTNPLNLLENWRGLAKKRKAKYLSSKEDITKCVEKKSLFISKSKNRLLKNGNIIPPIKIENRLVYVTHTCPFDAIAQILANAYLSLETYRSYVNSTGNKLLTFIKDFASEGATKKIYTERARLLLTLHPEAPLKTQVDCTGNVIDLANSFLKNEPSATRIFQCPVCSKTVRVPLETVIVNPEHFYIQGYKNLQDYVQVAINESQKITCDKCGKYYNKTAYGGNHLVIDVEFTNFASDEKVRLSEIRLDELPVELRILGSLYTLSGAIKLIQSTIEGSPGHYIAYCRKINANKWEVHDGLQNGIIEARPSRLQMKISALFYIKIQD